MKKKLIILSTIGVILIGIIAGASYAYFTVGNSTGNEDVITSGTMSLLLTDGAEVTANNLVPGDYVEKIFKVKNTGNVDTRYDIYLSEVINTFVDKTDLVYTLTSLDGGYNTSSEVQVPDTETKIVNQQLITPNAEHTYTLRLTFKQKQTIQNANMGRTFTAKININEFNLNSGEHFLKLIDANGEEVDKQILATNKENYTLALNNTDLTNSTNIYCNNGGIPTINGNTLRVTGITTDSECRISNDIVDTFTNKLTTAKTGIVMTNNQSGTTFLSVPSTKEVVLDLNGKEIKTKSYDEEMSQWNSSYDGARIDGKLLINDNIGTGGLLTKDYSRTFTVNSSGNLIINGGNYIGAHSLDIVGGNNAYVEINGGHFSSSRYQILVIGETGCNNCRMVINDGVFETDKHPVISSLQNSNQITINGGHFDNSQSNNTTIENKGTINISNGYFKSKYMVIYNNTNGTVNVNGGVFESINDSVIKNMDGIVNIKQTNNPIYIKTNGGSWSPAINNNSSGSLNIIANKANNCNANKEDTTSGLCIYSTSCAVANYTGNTKIDGGSYTNTNYPTIEATGSGNLYAKNVNVNASAIGVATGNSSGTLYLCNSNVYSNNWDTRTLGSDSKIYYSSNVIFTDGTNNPNKYNSGVGATTLSSDACSWTMPSMS